MIFLSSNFLFIFRISRSSVKKKDIESKDRITLNIFVSKQETSNYQRMKITKQSKNENHQAFNQKNLFITHKRKTKLTNQKLDIFKINKIMRNTKPDYSPLSRSNIIT